MSTKTPKETFDLTDPTVAQMAQEAPETHPDHPLITGKSTANMLVEKDVQITCSDGAVVVCDVFRPNKAGQFPVLMSCGPYGKDIPFELHWPYEYARSGEHSPYMTIETVNPESWVADDYVVVRVDQTGTGKSPGVIDVWSPRDTGHFVDSVEWAGAQNWSSGKVGLIGVSYYSASQIAVAANAPASLAAIIPWEVGHNLYSEFARHGGIRSSGFVDFWFQFWILSNQHGRTVLDEEQLATNWVNFPQLAAEHELFDEFWQERTADPSRVNVPLFTAGNWAGPSMVLRSHIDLYQQATSCSKWLRVHTGGHIEPFY